MRATHMCAGTSLCGPAFFPWNVAQVVRLLPLAMVAVPWHQLVRVAGELLRTAPGYLAAYSCRDQEAPVCPCKGTDFREGFDAGLSAGRLTWLLLVAACLLTFGLGFTAAHRGCCGARRREGIAGHALVVRRRGQLD